MVYLWIAIGSAIGGVSRYALGVWILSKYSSGYPWHTFVINILGSVLIGLFATTVRPAPLRLFLTVGICGGFTTFSSFSYETVTLLRDGHSARALAYAGLSVLVCVAGAWVGHVAGTALTSE